MLYGVIVGSSKVGEAAEMGEHKIYLWQKFRLWGQKLD